MTDTSIDGGGADARPDERTAALNQISWGAVFAGVVVALTVQLVLNLLGVGIGAAALDPGAADNPTATAFSIAGGLWRLVAGLIGAFAGGYVSGRVSGRPVKAVAVTSAEVVSRGALLGFLALALAAAAAWLGGALGTARAARRI